MNVLITGGAGFIGSNFVFHMLDTYPEYRIVCLDKLTYAGNLSTLASVMDNPQFRFVKADICDREAVDKVFDLRPTAIIEMLDLRKPQYRQLAAYGHMGREDLGVAWEKTDRVDALKAALA